LEIGIRSFGYGTKTENTAEGKWTSMYLYLSSDPRLTVVYGQMNKKIMNYTQLKAGILKLSAVRGGQLGIPTSESRNSALRDA
jgi:hypothetical protein